MGMKHGNTATYPQVGRLIGYIPKEEVVDVCEKILTVQRDYGNREERTNARFKYTVDRLGVDWIRNEINNRLGWQLETSVLIILNIMVIAMGGLKVVVNGTIHSLFKTDV